MANIDRLVGDCSRCNSGCDRTYLFQSIPKGLRQHGGGVLHT